MIGNDHRHRRGDMFMCRDYPERGAQMFVGVELHEKKHFLNIVSYCGPATIVSGVR